MPARARRGAVARRTDARSTRYATVTSRSAVASSVALSVGPTATHERRACASRGAGRRAVRRRRGAWFVSSRQADVDAVVARERACGTAARPRRRWPGHVDRPAGQRRERGDVLGRLVRAAVARRVVRRADADEHGAEIVVAEVELELLVRALDEERRVRVRDRPVALEREAGGDADHQLLADADVEEARVPRTIVATPISASTTATRSSSSSASRGEPRRSARASSSLRLHLRDDDVRARARRRRASAPRARRGRGRRRAPRSSPRARSARSMPPGQPCVDEWLSTTTAVSAPSPIRPAYCTASQLRALVELAVADEAVDAPPGQRGADRDRRARGRASRSRSRRPARARGRGGSRAASRTSPKPSSASTGRSPFAASTA